MGNFLSSFVIRTNQDFVAHLAECHDCCEKVHLNAPRRRVKDGLFDGAVTVLDIASYKQTPGIEYTAIRNHTRSDTKQPKNSPSILYLNSSDLHHHCQGPYLIKPLISPGLQAFVCVKLASRYVLPCLHCQ